MNEVAELCERLNVDVGNVRLGMGSDERIGYSFIYPGAGYGGSCFPKNVRALIHMARENQYHSMVLQAVHERNEDQKHVLFRNKSQPLLGLDITTSSVKLICPMQFAEIYG